MSFFPMYMDMQDLKVLVVGGGYIATEKLEKLVDFTKEITVITDKVSEESKYTYKRVLSDTLSTSLCNRRYRRF